MGALLSLKTTNRESDLTGAVLEGVQQGISAKAEAGTRGEVV